MPADRVRQGAGDGGSRAVVTRLAGMALFLPVPVVLWLLTTLPLGPWLSLALGLGLMLTHSLYARPFALRRAATRCLWCGGPAQPAEVSPAEDGGWSVASSSGWTGPRTLTVRLREPRGETNWRTCGPAHYDRCVRTLHWAERRERLLRLGILGALVLFLASTVGAALGPAPWTLGDASAFFRLAIAVLVLPLGWLGPASTAPSPGPRIVTPFPVHIQALVGTWAVVWLFRLIGILWLVRGAVHFITRILSAAD